MNSIYESKTRNIIFSLFFALFFTLYQFVWIQIILFVLLAVYVLNDLYKNTKMKIPKKTYKNIIFYFCWFGIFTIYAFLSKKWAIGVISDSRTLSTLLRMFIVGFLIFVYCNNKERAVGIVKSYIFGVLIMGIIIMLFTPPRLYGVETGIETFGGIIYQHRNAIASAAVESILYILLLRKFFSFKYYKIFICFFLILIICSGSRGAIVELLLFFILYFIFNLKNKKVYKYIPIALILFFVSYAIINSIPFLSDKIFNRFNDMFSTLLSGSNVDGSTYSRSLMRKVAFSIFEKYPIFGAGVDGVAVYLSNAPVQFGYTFRAVYSHCNYAELAADFGLFGLVLWYSPMIRIIKKMLNKIKNWKNPLIKHCLCIFASILFIDNYKIPWTDYLPIFSYFCIIILILNLIEDEQEKRNIKEAKI